MGQPRLRLLVIDDEPMLARALHRALSRSFDVHLAADGSTAKQAVTTFRPDYILCDVRLATETGPQIISGLVQQYPNLRGRIVFMSAMPAAQTPELSDLNADVLDKPFSTEELHRALGQLGAPLPLG